MLACCRIGNIGIVQMFKFINKVNSRKHKLVYRSILSFLEIKF